MLALLWHLAEYFVVNDGQIDGVKMDKHNQLMADKQTARQKDGQTEFANLNIPRSLLCCL